MAIRNNIESGSNSAFLKRLVEEADKIVEQRKSVTYHGTFHQFMISEFQRLDDEHPDIAMIIRSGMNIVNSPSAKIDIFWRLWGTFKAGEIVVQEFGVPVQPDIPR